MTLVTVLGTDYRGEGDQLERQENNPGELECFLVERWWQGKQ